MENRYKKSELLQQLLSKETAKQLTDLAKFYNVSEVGCVEGIIEHHYQTLKLSETNIGVQND